MVAPSVAVPLTEARHNVVALDAFKPAIHEAGGALEASVESPLVPFQAADTRAQNVEESVDGWAKARANT